MMSDDYNRGYNVGYNKGKRIGLIVAGVTLVALSIVHMAVNGLVYVDWV